MNASFLSGLDGWNKPGFEVYANFTEIVLKQTEFSDLDSTDSVNVKIMAEWQNNATF